MKKNEVQVGASYIAKVSGKLAEVRITNQSRFGGWDAVNVATKKAVRIKSAQRLRAAAGKPKAKADAPKAKPAAANPLLGDGDFTDAINAATVEQLREALAADTLSPRNRNRVEIALKTRTVPPPAPADDVARTVEAVARGDLTQGVTVPTVGKKKGSPRGATPEGKMSGLDAAAKVLAEAGEPMNAKAIVEAMAAKGYWSSTAATPHATIYAAMIVEIAKKGDAARFRKTDRGLFTVAAAGKKAQ